MQNKKWIDHEIKEIDNIQLNEARKLEKSRTNSRRGWVIVNLTKVN